MSSSDLVEGEDLWGDTISAELEWASWVLRESDGDAAEGLGVLVVDGVLDGVTSVESEVEGDDSAKGDNAVAVASGVLSGGSRSASRANLAGEVVGDATGEASEPWKVDVTLSSERAGEDTSDDLANWVGDRGRGSEDVSGEGDVGGGEDGGRGSVPDEETREWNEGLETNLADADRGGSNNVDDDGGCRRETSDVNTTGVGEISGVNGEDLEGSVGTEEGDDVVGLDVDTSGWDGVGISQSSRDGDDGSSEGITNAELSTRLEERWVVQRELAVSGSGEWWNSDGVRELARRSVDDVTDNVASDNSGGTSRDVRVSRDAAIISWGLDEIETKRDTSEGESSSSGGSSSNVSRADGGKALGGDLEVAQPSEGILSALTREGGDRSSDAVAVGVNTKRAVGVSIADTLASTRGISDQGGGTLGEGWAGTSAARSSNRVTDARWARAVIDVNLDVTQDAWLDGFEGIVDLGGARE